MAETSNEAVDEYLELYRKILNEVAYFLDGLELDSETQGEIDEILDSIESKLICLHSLAEDCFNAANAGK